MKFIKNIFLIIIAFFIAVNIQNYSLSNTLKFVQLSDIHYTTKKDDTTFKALGHSKELLEDAIAQINSIPNLDMIMITGDLTDSPTIEAVEEVMPYVNGFYRPWYMAFGNHDISISGKLTKKKYLEILRENNSGFTFEKSYYSFSPKKHFRVIVLDAIIDDRVTGNGVISAEEMEWLDNEIANSKDEVIMLFMHHPVKEPFKSPGHRLNNAQELTNMLLKHKKPIAIFTGHYHAAKIYEENNILYVCSPSLVTYPNAFRLITVKDNKNEIIYDIKFMETGREDIQNKAKLKLFAATTYAGEESDKNNVYTLKK